MPTRPPAAGAAGARSGSRAGPRRSASAAAPAHSPAARCRRAGRPSRRGTMRQGRQAQHLAPPRAPSAGRARRSRPRTWRRARAGSRRSAPATGSAWAWGSSARSVPPPRRSAGRRARPRPWSRPRCWPARGRLRRGAGSSSTSRSSSWVRSAVASRRSALPFSSCELVGQRLLAGPGAGDLALDTGAAAPGAPSRIRASSWPSRPGRLDLGMALAVLAGQLGLAPQQLGLERQQIVQHGELPSSPRRRRCRRRFDQPPQPRRASPPCRRAPRSPRPAGRRAPAISAGSAP